MVCQNLLQVVYLLNAHRIEIFDLMCWIYYVWAWYLLSIKIGKSLLLTKKIYFFEKIDILTFKNPSKNVFFEQITPNIKKHYKLHHWGDFGEIKGGSI